MSWNDTGGRPAGFAFREPLAVGDGIVPATLFMAAYFKPATVPGVRDKLSVSLCFMNYRILGIDDNGPSRHYNHVGVDRPHYRRAVDHPQLHTVSDDCIYGYAEPFATSSNEDTWRQFLALCHIEGAPSFQLPIFQMGLIYGA